MNNFSYRKMFLKGLEAWALFLVPILVNQFIVQYPELAQLTVGGILVMGSNFLTHYKSE